MKAKSIILTLVFSLTLLQGAECAARTRKWSLQDCIDYAMENNISLRQARNRQLSGFEDTRQAKAAFFPNLNASVSQGLTNRPFTDSGNSTVIGSDVYSTSGATSYSGNYGLNASWTLFSGGSLVTSLRQSRLQNSLDSLSVQESANDIALSLVQAYMQCLYAAEAVRLGELSAESSKAQLERAVELKNVGELSKVDVAQLESQYASDRYQITAAKASLDNYRLQLKQLLELEISDEIELEEPSDGDEEVLRLLPSKEEVYLKALDAMPEIKKAELNVTASELGIRQAKSSYSPTLMATASLGTTNVSGLDSSFDSQIRRNFSESIGLSLQIPIFQGRKVKTAVNKARIALDDSRLEQLSTRKALLKEVEDIYLNAVSAQSKYTSAKEQEKYAEQSYDLTFEQFNVGMKNTVELITAKNNLLNARAELLQAKYTALMNNTLLDIYQGNQKINTQYESEK